MLDIKIIFENLMISISPCLSKDPFKQEVIVKELMCIQGLLQEYQLDSKYVQDVRCYICIVSYRLSSLYIGSYITKNGTESTAP